MEFQGFEPTIFHFLEELADNNNRPWFQANKARYEHEVRQPCLAFIRAFRPRLKKISGFFLASDRTIGGSLMRVYRDTRFAKDKTPYKTNAGIQFRHEFGRDVHAPGFYVHIAPSDCFLGVGTWRPHREALGLIRQAILDRPERWRRTSRNRKFRDYFGLEGNSLKRAPRGVPTDHPLIDDLKRTDFLGFRPLGEDDVLDASFADATATAFAAGRPLMRFLSEALNVPF